MQTSMILNEHYTLANGVEIPKLGLGTWFISNADATPTVTSALDAGYRHIDTAQAYRNERGVGEGIRRSGLKREEVFVTTKLAAEAKTHAKATSGIDASLSALGVNHIDLMLIHSPRPWRKFHGADRYFEGNLEAWRALEEAYQAGKIRAIGVSNFEREDLDNIIGACTVKPMVNQILAHISNTPFELIDYSAQQGMLVEAYSPVAHGELLKNEQVAAVAERYGVSIPQLSIRYTLQLGLLPLPKTANPDHMRTNAEVDFVIADEDMEALRNIEQIKDYGDASIMPVYGGELNASAMVKMAWRALRGR